MIRQGGIIAAGEGRRLREAGFTGSKAMARVGGRPLIAHAIERFRAAGIERLTVIINAESQDCRDFLEGEDHGLELDLVVKSTPSSYASFQVVASRLGPEPALITTVDSILRLEDFVGFARAAGELPQGAFALGLTDHVDDEKPLWARLDPMSGRVTALGGEGGELVTAGMYVLPSGSPPQPDQPAARLRDYLGWLLGQGHAIYGFVLPGVFDVDRASDVVQAEQALAGQDRQR